MSLTIATAAVEALLRAGPLETCTIVDVYLDDGVLHYSDLFAPLTLDDGIEGPVVYTPMGDRLIPPTEIQETQALGSTGIEVYLDSSRISDPTDEVGALVDKQVTQRRIRLRTVLFEPGTARSVPAWLFNVRDGIVNGLDDAITVGDMPALKVRIASGAFAYNERRNMTYGPADQKELYPGDTGFDKAARVVDVKLNWHS